MTDKACGAKQSSQGESPEDHGKGEPVLETTASIFSGCLADKTDTMCDFYNPVKFLVSDVR